MAVKRDLFPSWKQLLITLAEKLEAEGKHNRATIVRSFVDEGEVLEAADQAVKALGLAHFRDVMKTTFGVTQPFDVDLSLTKAIWSLNPCRIVTTNYDRVLEWANPKSQIQLVKNSEASNLADLFQTATADNPFVWHLHGHISDPDSLILSPSQYNELYRHSADDKHPLAKARNQLRSLIPNYPLLFIGFGLQDEYVMDVIGAMLDMFEGNLRQSYALLKQGDNRAEELWKKFNIEVISYNDYGEPLVELLSNIRSEADNRQLGRGDVVCEPMSIPASYTRWLVRQCPEITAFGIAPIEGQSVSLQQVYVPLLTTKSEARVVTTKSGKSAIRHAKRSLTNTTAAPDRVARIIRHQQLMLARLGEESLYVSGDPGSGKSTFCRWISWLTSTGEIPSFVVEAPDEFKETFPESLRGRLPLMVRLREFGAYLPAQPGRKTLSTAEFESALEKWLMATKQGGLHWSDVTPHLKAGSLLLILDGVDELPLSDGHGRLAWSPRESVLAGVSTAAPEWVVAGNRLLITSRPYGLDSDQVRMLERSGLAETRIERLPETLQGLLATRWFVALPKTSAEGVKFAQDMLLQVRQLPQGFNAFGENPLLLTAICIIYGEGKQLPRDIHELYDRIVKTSLHSRYPKDPCLIEPVRARLAAVALGMHTGDPAEPKRAVPEAEISFEELSQILAKYRCANLETESGFKDQVHIREDLLNYSGLLSQGSDRRAGFYHLSFQEFLAAEQITRHNEGVSKLFKVFEERSHVANWRLTLRFLMSRRATIGHKAVVELLDRILNKIEQLGVTNSVGLSLNLVDGLAILLDRGIQLQPPLPHRVSRICLKAIEHEIPLQSRMELALMLGRLGDPRIFEAFDDENAWISVPVAQSTGESGSVCNELKLSKYPVTNLQFSAFAKEGYSRKELWSEEGWEWKKEFNVTESLYYDTDMWNAPNSPVVGVSWWEADAFCRWHGGRLPRVSEWIAAAVSCKSSLFPWGAKFLPSLANTRESGLLRICPVGMFPGGTSESGMVDAVGNVQEWCLGDDTGLRPLCGSSWASHNAECKLEKIANDVPSTRNQMYGFRIIMDNNHCR